MNHTNIQNVARVLRKAGVSLYKPSFDGGPKRRAQVALEGRTPYCSPESLRFHHSRVLEAGVAMEGMFYWIVESVSADFHNTSRGFRPVVFDVFGRTLESRRSVSDLLLASTRARNELHDVLENLDPAAYYRDAFAHKLTISRRALEIEADAHAALAALAV